MKKINDNVRILVVGKLEIKGWHNKAKEVISGGGGFAVASIASPTTSYRKS